MNDNLNLLSLMVCVALMSVLGLLLGMLMVRYITIVVFATTLIIAIGVSLTIVIGENRNGYDE